MNVKRTSQTTDGSDEAPPAIDATCSDAPENVEHHLRSKGSVIKFPYLPSISQPAKVTQAI